MTIQLFESMISQSSW